MPLARAPKRGNNVERLRCRRNIGPRSDSLGKLIWSMMQQVEGVCSFIVTLIMSTKILIVGAGAVGAFYASRLAQVRGAEVSVVCRSNYKAVAANGFQVTSPKYGDYTFTPTKTFANPQEARKSGIDWDYVVVSTKALPDVSDDSEILEGLVSDSTAIVLIQNGLGVESPYEKRFPKVTILSAVTIVSAAQTSPGKIKHNRWTRISIGPWQTRNSNEARGALQNKRFVDLLQAGGIKDAECYDHANLQFVRWHKIAINASMNPSSVLSNGSTNESMANDEELYRHLKGVMDEVLATAPKVIGSPLPAGLATSEQILNSTKRNTSGSKPSMQLDWEQGKRMELEVILGNPIRMAREKGFEMPRLQTLYALLRKAQENRKQQAAAAKKSKL
jgi:2-dehydropantoate 2-reductase